MADKHEYRIVIIYWPSGHRKFFPVYQTVMADSEQTAIRAFKLKHWDSAINRYDIPMARGNRSLRLSSIDVAAIPISEFLASEYGRAGSA